MVGVCCACAQGAARAEEVARSVLVARGHSSAAEQMHRSIAAETEMARQDFITRSPPRNANSFSQRSGRDRMFAPEAERVNLAERQILTRHHSSLHGRRDIWRAGPSGCTMKLSEKFEPMPFAGSYKPGSTENAMPGSSMV